MRREGRPRHTTTRSKREGCPRYLTPRTRERRRRTTRRSTTRRRDNGEEDNKEEEIEENGEEEEEGDSQEPIVQSPITENMENTTKGPCTPETQPTHPENHHLDTPPRGDTTQPAAGGRNGLHQVQPTQGEEECFSFMEEEDDEIRV
ncbi:hypothetical protein SKAU_G00301390 [Synaphobranchus kaupii]|uniref:Uncharacterized protein n=1 Tax=Synaphobranchus kaupii TaxID=118154 RepID=A0A9Q1EVU3_SYNKA|nr:hypothetical protein SKAU_G00301390 [Synaphobranchus kaupii]